MNDEEQAMTQYLLGELSQPEQTALEERYFSDSGLFVQLLETENDLIDDYARGHLSATLRRRFEQHYLAHPKRRARLRFGEALIARLDDIEQSSSTPAARMSGWDQLLAGFRGSTPARVFSMTLAVSLIVVAGVWFFTNNARLRRELREAQNARLQQEQLESDLRKQVEGERARVDQLAGELDRLRLQQQNARSSPTPPGTLAPAFASLILTIEAVRGAQIGPPATLEIPSGTDKATFQLNLVDIDYPTYNVELQTADGKQVFKSAGLLPKSKARPSVVVIVPANRLPEGDYILTLKGVSSNGEVEDVSKSLLRVERK